MTTRRLLLAAWAVFLAATTIPVSFAAGPVPFDQAGFEAAQAAGKPILVEVTAPWCPICRAQKPILARLAAEPRFRDLVIFEIDFDTRKDALRRLDARMQSTLIAFKGREEVGRSIGETQAEWIESFLEKTL